MENLVTRDEMRDTMQTAEKTLKEHYATKADLKNVELRFVLYLVIATLAIISENAGWLAGVAKAVGSSG